MLSISYADYFNKVHGGWIGKCIGGTIGAAMEGNRELMTFTLDNVFPAEIPPNDDLDLQILWLQVLEQKGARLESRDLADAWLEYCWYPFNEYGYFVKNYRLGIAPPYSGHFNNEFFKNSMGCPIRSEIWGFVCPGNPQLAAEYAYKDGVLDHDTESVYGEQFFAALEAEAFFETDIFELIAKGLALIPADSIVAQCIQFVIDRFNAGVTWMDTRREILVNYGSPDASHCVENVGFTVLALLFGRGDFTDTMLIAVNSGYDTDCTAATSGAILGQILGGDSIPQVWLDKMGAEYVMWFDLHRRSMLISDLAEDTCKAGLSLIRDGLVAVKITEIPQHIEPSLPVAPAIPLYSLEVIYLGNPSIGFGETADVEVVVFNRSSVGVAGVLSIGLPESLLCESSSIPLTVESGGELKLQLHFSVHEKLIAFPQKNVVSLSWNDGETLFSERSFGFSGAVRMKVIGPFWDSYDTQIHGEVNPYLNGKPAGRAWFNNFINIDKAYIDENFADLEQTAGTYVNFHTDKLALNEIFSHRGQSCLYLVHNIISPVARDAYAVIGNNDAYKFWLNGQLTSEAKEHTMWMPYNNDVPIKLKRGRNQFIFKIVRSDNNFEFSIGLRGDLPFMQEPNFTHWYVDLASSIDN
ncbi:ADP-ribosylglycohydrolase family protein [Paenibacillus psychroresistens]|uniref:ADP-ribosylglycohydrolase family protein n=1 Tax=Paenibacillus psychroresistens TaxID=1778678 RepID=A0A6B8RSR7_9BACL|nr:ADP-ribosylglycohydrolase family protein [Paenibacillus psychroresistens]QGQ98503.1 ADP-ribosylglycohydrolase family protein [Paenibacillus psychroresistens]